jgi:tRNA-2-methylthio-N6-dimethylallyladenosine synthase
MDLSKTNKNKSAASSEGAFGKFYIKTYGCQMNFHDSGLIEDGLIKNGFQKADSAGDAGIIIFNTCSVRDHADHKIISELGRLKKNSPDKKIVLAGCFAKQIKLKSESAASRNKSGGRLFFDYSFGPDEIMSIPELLKAGNESAAGSSGKDDYEDSALIEEYFYGKEPDRGEATVKITEGCNNYCSYCIVPYVRGKERSIPFDIAYNTVKKQILKGASEIILLGQNVNSYKSPEDGGKDFCYLLDALSDISGIKKIKFLTSHPKDFSDQLIQTICRNDNISKEIHLPVQSGSDKILSAMNRGYAREDYLKLIGKLRKECPDVSVSTDIIVGFPGETDEDFEATLSLMDEVNFSFIFGFKYSPRPFTKAFEIKDDISLEVKKERLERIFRKQKKSKNT